MEGFKTPLYVVNCCFLCYAVILEQLLDESKADMWQKWRGNNADLMEKDPQLYYYYLVQYLGYNPFQEQAEMYADMVVKFNYNSFLFIFITSIVGVSVPVKITK